MEVLYRDASQDFDRDLNCQNVADVSFYCTTSALADNTRESVRRLVSQWLRAARNPEDLVRLSEVFRVEGWQLILDHRQFDRVLLGVAESSWNFAISELLTSAAYFQASVSQFDLVLAHRADIENAESLLMLDCLQDLFRKVSDLSGSSMSSIGLVYLGWFIHLALDLLCEKISTTDFVLSTTQLTTHFNHQVVGLKGLLLRQSLPQVLTSRASAYLPK